MRAQASGRILFVSSVGARVAAPGIGIYFASKAAVSTLAETLALEVAPLGIKVTAIEPGAMRTRFAKPESMHVSPFDPAYEKTVGAVTAMSRSSRFDEIARDPAGHAAIILKVAAIEEPPVILLTGPDAFERGTAADAKRHASDLQWEELSRST